MINSWHIKRAARSVDAGGVIAYPTESVYGLGCAPLNLTAVERILAIKQRPISKGMIIVASEIEQLSGYVDFNRLPTEALDFIAAKWPGPVTFTLPAVADAPNWITGKFDSIAVRLSSHPVVVALCDELCSPLVSTSANYSGRAPAKTALQVRHRLQPELAYIVNAPVGNLERPTPIIDPITRKTLRV